MCIVVNINYKTFRNYIKRNNSHSNIHKKHQEHRNEKQGAVGSDIINEVNHYIPRSILDHNININNYKNKIF